ncbi:MAG: GLPGLI family protein [Mucilaginibacter sp.]|nr:GLPGLI family protein [Mucilaginibacter sp.]
MKKIIAIISICTFATLSTLAQNIKFIRSGTIEYKKTVNVYAIIQRSINKENETLLRPAFETYKQQYKQFKELKSTLTFAENKTLFTPISVNTNITSYFDDPQISMQNNIVFSDLNDQQIISKRKVFDATYLLKDSLRTIRWKFTDEVRDIMGYPCHRANGLTTDSIYVVAFYTDKIPVSGGPESFGGLPGMILQLALPHENVSWIATKIEDRSIPEHSISSPTGGTSVKYQELIDKLREVFSKSGNTSLDLKAFLL